MSANYVFEGDYKNLSGNVKVKLFIVHFQDENGVHFVYSPHLDLTGYGEDFNSAKESFFIVFEDFVDYTLNKKTMGVVLTKLVWNLIKGKVKKPRKIQAPSITDVIKDNKYVSEIFDKYPTETYHEEVGLPVFA